MTEFWTKLFAAGTLLALFPAGTFAAKFVKNAHVGGYRIVVEGGGVEKRKEVQYDARGNLVFSTANVDLNQLKEFDFELDEESGEFNLDPFAADDAFPDEPGENNAAVDDGLLDLPVIELDGVPAAEKKSRERKKLSSPWIATREIKKIQAKNAAEERKRIAREQAEKDAAEIVPEVQDTGEIYLDPTQNMLQKMKTDDGRELPFYISGKDPQGEVDGHSALKNYMKMNETLLGKKSERYDGKVEIEKTDRYDNVIAFDKWHSKYSSLGQKRYENVPESPSLFQKMFGNADKRYERRENESGMMNAVWGRDGKTSVIVNEQLAKEISEKFNRTNRFSTELLLPNPNQGGISMQGINRYLFRRSHSDEPGLPVVSPGNADVKIKK